MVSMRSFLTILWTKFSFVPGKLSIYFQKDKFLNMNQLYQTFHCAQTKPQSQQHQKSSKKKESLNTDVVQYEQNWFGLLAAAFSRLCSHQASAVTPLLPIHEQCGGSRIHLFVEWGMGMQTHNHYVTALYSPLRVPDAIRKRHSQHGLLFAGFTGSKSFISSSG